MALWALTACSAKGDDSEASAEATGGGQASQYEYSPAGFQQCLDDRGVRYREDDQGGLTLVDQGSAAAQAAADECQQLTTRPVAEGESARINRISQAIIDCLDSRGYHVEAETNGHFVDGTPALGYSVPQAEQESPDFRTDLDDCTRGAEEANPES